MKSLKRNTRSFEYSLRASCIDSGIIFARILDILQSGPIFGKMLHTLYILLDHKFHRNRVAIVRCVY